MLRVRENLFGWAGFDNFAVLHHTNPIRDFAHDGQVVGDEQHRHGAVAFQIL